MYKLNVYKYKLFIYIYPHHIMFFHQSVHLSYYSIQIIITQKYIICLHNHVNLRMHNTDINTYEENHPEYSITISIEPTMMFKQAIWWR